MADGYINAALHLYYFSSNAFDFNPYSLSPLIILYLLTNNESYMVTVIKKGTPKEEIKRRINKIISKGQQKGIMKYAGKIDLKIDPLIYQRNLRNEWK